MSKEQLISICIIILVVFILFKFYHSWKYSYKNNNFLPYRKKYLLTKNELNFYKKLKPIAEKNGLRVISKIRLADLVEVDTSKTKEFGRFFSKISSKHIDFGLVSPSNMEVKYLIELDDNSHRRNDRIERDEFVNKLCEKTGYVLIRTYGDIDDIEDVISRR